MVRKLVRLSQLIKDVEDRGDDPDSIYIDLNDTAEIEEAEEDDLDED